MGIYINPLFFFESNIITIRQRKNSKSKKIDLNPLDADCNFYNTE